MIVARKTNNFIATLSLYALKVLVVTTGHICNAVTELYP